MKNSYPIQSGDNNCAYGDAVLFLVCETKFHLKCISFATILVDHWGNSTL